jgi:hypothetical protein
MGARKERNIGPGTKLNKISWIPEQITKELQKFNISTFRDLRRSIRRNDKAVRQTIQDTLNTRDAAALLQNINAVQDDEGEETASEAEATL